MSNQPRDTYILVLAVDDSDVDALADIKDAVNRLVCESLVWVPRNEIALIICGEEGEQGLRKINVRAPPNVDLIQALHDLCPAEIGDISEGITEAAGLIQQRAHYTSIQERHLWIFSGGDSEVTDITEGTREQLIQWGVDVQFFVPRVELVCESLAQASGQFNCQVRPIAEMIVPCHTVSRSTKCRVDMNFGQGFNLPIQMLIKTRIEPFPSFKSSHNGQTLRQIRSYFVENEEVPVEEDEIVSGFLYGREVVPIDEDTMKSVQFKPGEKSFKVLGSVHNTSISEIFLVGGTEMVLPEPGNEQASKGMASLCEALRREEMRLLCRYVYNRSADVRLCLLTPAPNEGLYLNYVPFTNDIRDLGIRRIHRDPTEVQVEQMEGFIDDAMLETSLGTELLPVGATPNPSLAALHAYSLSALKNELGDSKPERFVETEALFPPRELLARLEKGGRATEVNAAFASSILPPKKKIVAPADRPSDATLDLSQVSVGVVVKTSQKLKDEPLTPATQTTIGLSLEDFDL
ncbi:MAG: hypothetical protein KVP17_002246 [Porospora cf. gigantea B]|uniref:uncharacterized protein n=1 Tax=Porospora cf. gigantea B TaxID=2853592 RepID=UPI0035719D1C|nr:MAG: hypothetical protein KVP17_002246 [Porospora cf. gigantea B]